MNGAEAAIRIAVKTGVDTCFANPGTTEMPFLVAMDSISGMRAVLGLFEGVCTGAADGYARMSGKPALTLLHLGPGLANGLANLHNARRAHSPVVNLIGEHSTWHLPFDAPLTSDIESLARPVSGWVRTVRSARDLPIDCMDAIIAASSVPGLVASLIVPLDFQSGQASDDAKTRKATPPSDVPEDVVQRVAKVLAERNPAALLLGGKALLAGGLPVAARIAAITGCHLLCDTFPARIERGAGLPAVERIPYFPEQAMQKVSGYSAMILVGTRDPVTFFGYPGMPSRVRPESCELVRLAHPEENLIDALESLADLLNARGPGVAAPAFRPARPAGPLTPRTLGEAIAAVQPEGLIVIDEAATSGLPYFLMSAGVPHYDHLTLTGGAIGQGLPCAAGASIACPQRKVLAFQADGSGMYTVQALWTHAREGLDVTTVICANRSYRVLRMELERAGIKEPGPQAAALTDLSNPAIDWVSLARGMGVPGVRVETADALASELERSLAESGPRLIEALMS